MSTGAVIFCLVYVACGLAAACFEVWWDNNKRYKPWWEEPPSDADRGGELVGIALLWWIILPFFLIWLASNAIGSLSRRGEG